MIDLVDEDIYENDELKHWGILGMKWGIRRYQNEDGSLTPEGRERYGVKTAAETKKLSYSKDYESLKAKKNRTEKENEKLKRLEEGKKHFEKSTFDKNYWEKLKDNNTHDYVENAAANYSEFLKSTNYGKGMAKVEVMMAIPTTAIGAAADIGAIYVQRKAGARFVLAGLGTSFGLTAGLNIGAEIYGNKNLDLLKEELKNNKEPALESKTERKYLGNDNYTLSTKDISSDMENDLLKWMNLDRREGETYKDIVKDSDGYIRRKDGKDFVYYIDGKKLKSGYFNDIPLDYQWAIDNGHDFDIDKPTNKQSNLKDFGISDKKYQKEAARKYYFANPQYFTNGKGQLEYEGKTYSNVDQLIDAITKNTTFAKL